MNTQKTILLITLIMAASATALRAALWPDFCKTSVKLVNDPVMVAKDQKIECRSDIIDKCHASIEGDYIKIPSACLDGTDQARLIRAECQPSACLAEITNPEKAPPETKAKVQELNNRSEQISAAIQNGNTNQLRAIQATSSVSNADKEKAQRTKDKLRNLQSMRTNASMVNAEPKFMLAAASPGAAPAVPAIDCFKENRHIKIPVNNGIIQADGDGKAHDINGNAEDLSFCQFSQEDALLELSNIRFKKLKLTGAVFSAGLLTNLTFEHCSMVGADFSASILTNAQFIYTHLLNSSFKFAEFDGSQRETFYGVIADNSDFSSATFNNTTFYYFNISHAILTASTWNNSIIKFSDLSGASFVATSGSRLQIGAATAAGMPVDATNANFNNSTISAISFAGPSIYAPTIVKDVSFDGTTSSCTFQNVQISATCTLPAPTLDQVKKGDKAC